MPLVDMRSPVWPHVRANHPKVLKTLLRSPPALLRPSGEKTLDPHQHELVVVRPLQRRPDLT